MNDKILFIIGIIITWLVTRFYYRLSAKDQKSILNKIPEELKKAIRDDRRELLTVKELNELLEQKTLDKSKDGLDVFKVCPKCGSAHLNRGKEWYVDGPDQAWQFNILECADCRWRADDLTS